MKKLLATAAVIGALALAITGCSSSSGGTAKSSCTNKVVRPSAPTVSVWAWYPNMKTVADNFNNTHKDVQVCWVTEGGGATAYNKYQTAISAGKGLPDIIMVEADHLPTYEIQGAIIDISKYGANEVKKNFSPGAWKDVSQGEAVYAIPVDGGPMGLVYRKDLLAKAGINTPPATWDEFAADAAKVKAATGSYMSALNANSPAWMLSAQIQAGANPFVYDLKNKKDITIKVNDEASKKVLNFWGNLVKQGLVSKDDGFTSDYVTNLGKGKYATWPSAAWTPGYMTGAGIDKAAGQWAASPIPTWSDNDPAINWGGSTFAVTNQSTQQKLAAKVATELYADQASLDDGWKNQVIFPLNQKVLSSEEFLNTGSKFFGGELVNKDVYVPVENKYEGMTYTPFQTYYYAQFQQLLESMGQGKLTGDQVADQLQDTLVKYAQGQGFTVKQ